MRFRAKGVRVRSVRVCSLGFVVFSVSRVAEGAVCFFCSASQRFFTSPIGLVMISWSLTTWSICRPTVKRLISSHIFVMRFVSLLNDQHDHFVLYALLQKRESDFHWTILLDLDGVSRLGNSCTVVHWFVPPRWIWVGLDFHWSVPLFLKIL